jgi:hypothetical protein
MDDETLPPAIAAASASLDKYPAGGASLAPDRTIVSDEEFLEEFDNMTADDDLEAKP